MDDQDFRLESLEKNTVYFSSVSQLNDPYEGLLYLDMDGISDSLRTVALTKIFSRDHEKGKKALTKTERFKKARTEVERFKKSAGVERFRDHVDRNTRGHFNDFLKTHHNSRFILSLARATVSLDQDEFPYPLSSMMLWGHYANGLKGMCIEYDYDELIRSLKENNEISLKAKTITYNQVNQPVIKGTTVLKDIIEESGKTSEEIQNAFCTKYKSWEYENEVRLISSKHKLNNIDEKCIRRIFVAKSNSDLMKKVIDILRKKTIKPELYEVITQEKIYGVGFRKLDYI